MYIIVVQRLNIEPPETCFFGPFPTQQRALEYASEMPVYWNWREMPLVVPDCIRVHFTLRH